MSITGKNKHKKGQTLEALVRSVQTTLPPIASSIAMPQEDQQVVPQVANRRHFEARPVSDAAASSSRQSSHPKNRESSSSKNRSKSPHEDGERKRNHGSNPLASFLNRSFRKKKRAEADNESQQLPLGENSINVSITSLHHHREEPMDADQNSLQPISRPQSVKTSRKKRSDSKSNAGSLTAASSKSSLNAQAQSHEVALQKLEDITEQLSRVSKSLDQELKRISVDDKSLRVDHPSPSPSPSPSPLPLQLPLSSSSLATTPTTSKRLDNTTRSTHSPRLPSQRATTPTPMNLPSIDISEAPATITHGESDAELASYLPDNPSELKLDASPQQLRHVGPRPQTMPDMKLMGEPGHGVVIKQAVNQIGIMRPSETTLVMDEQRVGEPSSGSDALSLINVPLASDPMIRCGVVSFKAPERGYPSKWIHKRMRRQVSIIAQKLDSSSGMRFLPARRTLISPRHGHGHGHAVGPNVPNRRTESALSDDVFSPEVVMRPASVQPTSLHPHVLPAQTPPVGSVLTEIRSPSRSRSTTPLPPEERFLVGPNGQRWLVTPEPLPEDSQSQLNESLEPGSRCLSPGSDASFDYYYREAIRRQREANNLLMIAEKPAVDRPVTPVEPLQLLVPASQPRLLKPLVETLPRESALVEHRAVLQLSDDASETQSVRMEEQYQTLRRMMRYTDSLLHETQTEDESANRVIFNRIEPLERYRIEATIVLAFEEESDSEDLETCRTDSTMELSHLPDEVPRIAYSRVRSSLQDIELPEYMTDLDSHRTRDLDLDLDDSDSAKALSYTTLVKEDQDHFDEPFDSIADRNLADSIQERNGKRLLSSSEDGNSNRPPASDTESAAQRLDDSVGLKTTYKKPRLESESSTQPTLDAARYQGDSDGDTEMRGTTASKHNWKLEDATCMPGAMEEDLEDQLASGKADEDKQHLTEHHDDGENSRRCNHADGLPDAIDEIGEVLPSDARVREMNGMSEEARQTQPRHREEMQEEEAQRQQGSAALGPNEQQMQKQLEVRLRETQQLQLQPQDQEELQLQPRQNERDSTWGGVRQEKLPQVQVLEPVPKTRQLQEEQLEDQEMESTPASSPQPLDEDSQPFNRSHSQRQQQEKLREKTLPPQLQLEQLESSQNQGSSKSRGTRVPGGDALEASSASSIGPNKSAKDMDLVIPTIVVSEHDFDFDFDNDNDYPDDSVGFPRELKDEMDEERGSDDELSEFGEAARIENSQAAAEEGENSVDSSDRNGRFAHEQMRVENANSKAPIIIDGQQGRSEVIIVPTINPPSSPSNDMRVALHEKPVVNIANDEPLADRNVDRDARTNLLSQSAGDGKPTDPTADIRQLEAVTLEQKSAQNNDGEARKRPQDDLPSSYGTRDHSDLKKRDVEKTTSHGEPDNRAENGAGSVAATVSGAQEAASQTQFASTKSPSGNFVNVNGSAEGEKRAGEERNVAPTAAAAAKTGDTVGDIVGQTRLEELSIEMPTASAPASAPAPQAPAHFDSSPPLPDLDKLESENENESEKARENEKMDRSIRRPQTTPENAVSLETAPISRGPAENLQSLLPSAPLRRAASPDNQRSSPVANETDKAASDRMQLPVQAQNSAPETPSASAPAKAEENRASRPRKDAGEVTANATSTTATSFPIQESDYVSGRLPIQEIDCVPSALPSGDDATLRDDDMSLLTAVQSINEPRETDQSDVGAPLDLRVDEDSDSDSDPPIANVGLFWQPEDEKFESDEDFLRGDGRNVRSSRPVSPREDKDVHVGPSYSEQRTNRRSQILNQPAGNSEPGSTRAEQAVQPTNLPRQREPEPLESRAPVDSLDQPVASNSEDVLLKPRRQKNRNGKSKAKDQRVDDEIPHQPSQGFEEMISEDAVAKKPNQLTRAAHHASPKDQKTAASTTGETPEVPASDVQPAKKDDVVAKSRHDWSSLPASLVDRDAAVKETYVMPTRKTAPSPQSPAPGETSSAAEPQPRNDYLSNEPISEKTGDQISSTVRPKTPVSEQKSVETPQNTPSTLSDLLKSGSLNERLMKLEAEVAKLNEPDDRKSPSVSSPSPSPTVPVDAVNQPEQAILDSEAAKKQSPSPTIGVEAIGDAAAAAEVRSKDNQFDYNRLPETLQTEKKTNNDEEEMPVDEETRRKKRNLAERGKNGRIDGKPDDKIAEGGSKLPPETEVFSDKSGKLPQLAENRAVMRDPITGRGISMSSDDVEDLADKPDDAHAEIGTTSTSALRRGYLPSIVDRPDGKKDGVDQLLLNRHLYYADAQKADENKQVTMDLNQGKQPSDRAETQVVPPLKSQRPENAGLRYRAEEQESEKIQRANLYELSEDSVTTALADSFEHLPTRLSSASVARDRDECHVWQIPLVANDKELADAMKEDGKLIGDRVKLEPQVQNRVADSKVDSETKPLTFECGIATEHKTTKTSEASQQIKPHVNDARSGSDQKFEFESRDSQCSLDEIDEATLRRLLQAHHPSAESENQTQSDVVSTCVGSETDYFGNAADTQCGLEELDMATLTRLLSKRNVDTVAGDEIRSEQTPVLKNLLWQLCSPTDCEAQVEPSRVDTKSGNDRQETAEGAAQCDLSVDDESQFHSRSGYYVSATDATNQNRRNELLCNSETQRGFDEVDDETLRSVLRSRNETRTFACQSSSWNSLNVQFNEESKLFRSRFTQRGIDEVSLDEQALREVLHRSIPSADQGNQTLYSAESDSVGTQIETDFESELKPPMQAMSTQTDTTLLDETGMRAYLKNLKKSSSFGESTWTAIINDLSEIEQLDTAVQTLVTEFASETNEHFVQTADSDDEDYEAIFGPKRKLQMSNSYTSTFGYFGVDDFAAQADLMKTLPKPQPISMTVDCQTDPWADPDESDDEEVSKHKRSLTQSAKPADRIELPPRTGTRTGTSSVLSERSRRLVTEVLGLDLEKSRKWEELTEADLNYWNGQTDVLLETLSSDSDSANSMNSSTSSLFLLGEQLSPEVFGTSPMAGGNLGSHLTRGRTMPQPLSPLRPLANQSVAANVRNPTSRMEREPSWISESSTYSRSTKSPTLADSAYRSGRFYRSMPSDKLKTLVGLRSDLVTLQPAADNRKTPARMSTNSFVAEGVRTEPLASSRQSNALTPKLFTNGATTPLDRPFSAARYGLNPGSQASQISERPISIGGSQSAFRRVSSTKPS